MRASPTPQRITAFYPESLVQTSSPELVEVKGIGSYLIRASGGFLGRIVDFIIGITPFGWGWTQLREENQQALDELLSHLGRVYGESAASATKQACNLDTISIHGRRLTAATVKNAITLAKALCDNHVLGSGASIIISATPSIAHKLHAGKELSKRQCEQLTGTVNRAKAFYTDYISLLRSEHGEEIAQYIAKGGDPNAPSNQTALSLPDLRERTIRHLLAEGGDLPEDTMLALNQYAAAKAVETANKNEYWISVFITQERIRALLNNPEFARLHFDQLSDEECSQLGEATKSHLHENPLFRQREFFGYECTDALKTSIRELAKGRNRELDQLLESISALHRSIDTPTPASPSADQSRERPSCRELKRLQAETSHHIPPPHEDISAERLQRYIVDQSVAAALTAGLSKVKSCREQIRDAFERCVAALSQSPANDENKLQSWRALWTANLQLSLSEAVANLRGVASQLPEAPPQPDNEPSNPSTLISKVKGLLLAEAQYYQGLQTSLIKNLATIFGELLSGDTRLSADALTGFVSEVKSSVIPERLHPSLDLIMAAESLRCGQNVRAMTTLKAALSDEQKELLGRLRQTSASLAAPEGLAPDGDNNNIFIIDALAAAKKRIDDDISAIECRYCNDILPIEQQCSVPPEGAAVQPPASRLFLPSLFNREIMQACFQTLAPLASALPLNYARALLTTFGTLKSYARSHLECLGWLPQGTSADDPKEPLKEELYNKIFEMRGYSSALVENIRGLNIPAAERAAIDPAALQLVDSLVNLAHRAVRLHGFVERFATGRFLLISVQGSVRQDVEWWASKGLGFYCPVNLFGLPRRINRATPAGASPDTLRLIVGPGNIAEEQAPPAAGRRMAARRDPQYVVTDITADVYHRYFRPAEGAEVDQAGLHNLSIKIINYLLNGKIFPPDLIDQNDTPRVAAQIAQNHLPRHLLEMIVQIQTHHAELTPQLKQVLRLIAHNHIAIAYEFAERLTKLVAPEAGNDAQARAKIFYVLDIAAKFCT